MEDRKVSASRVNLFLFWYYTLLAFTNGVFVFLYLLFLNPLFGNRVVPVVVFLLAAPLCAGALLTALTRLLETVLFPLRDRFSIPKAVMIAAWLLIFHSVVFLMMYSLTFPPPLASKWIFLPLVLLGVVNIPILRLATKTFRNIGEKNSKPFRSLFGRKLFIPAVLLIFCTVWTFAAPLFVKSPARLVVIGIDGATMKIMDRLISRGELPNIAGMKKEGTSGLLASIAPCLSPAVWTSISTGFLPESHGITNFNGTLDMVKKKGYWEILSENGEKVGLYRWLLTWPPVEVNGFLVPNWLARDTACYPPQLAHIKRTGGHGGFLYIRDILLDISYGLTAEGVVTILSGKAKEAVSELSVIDRNIAGERLGALKRRDYFIGLDRLYGVTFGACVFDGVDNFSHTLWQYMEPEHFMDVPSDLVEQYGESIEEHYREIDGFVGDIRKTLRNDSYLMVISDHGFQAADTIKQHPPKPRERLLKYLDLPAGRIQSSGYKFDRIFLGVKEGNGDDDVAERLEEQLENITFEGDDLPLLTVKRIDRTLRKYSTIFVVRAREGLTFQGDREVTLPLGKTEFRNVFTVVPGVSGDHDPADGVFFFSGPGVKKGFLIEGLSVLDIHPLVLYLYGQGVPGDIDGELRMDIFEDLPAGEPAFVETYGDRVTDGQREAPMSDEALERMKALGYIE